MVLRGRSVCNDSRNVLLITFLTKLFCWNRRANRKKKNDSLGVEDAEDFHEARETMAQKKTLLCFPILCLGSRCQTPPLKVTRPGFVWAKTDLRDKCLIKSQLGSGNQGGRGWEGWRIRVLAHASEQTAPAYLSWCSRSSRPRWLTDLYSFFDSHWLEKQTLFMFQSEHNLNKFHTPFKIARHPRGVEDTQNKTGLWRMIKFLNHQKNYAFSL